MPAARWSTPIPSRGYDAPLSVRLLLRWAAYLPRQEAKRRRPDRELHEIRRKQPSGRGLASQHDPAGRLAPPEVALGAHQNGELLELGGAQHRPAVGDRSEPHHRVHGRRGDPGDESAVTAERAGWRESLGGQDQPGARATIGRHVHGERPRAPRQLDARGHAGKTRHRQQLQTVEIPARTGGLRRIAGAILGGGGMPGEG